MTSERDKPHLRTVSSCQRRTLDFMGAFPRLEKKLRCRSQASDTRIGGDSGAGSLDGFAGAVLMTASLAAADERPFVIAHRGASGYVPEHTLAGYFIAIQQGTDYVEPDLVITRDGALVVRHENEIGGTTDVAAHPEFAARKTTKIIDGESLTGWFTEDFTLAELKTLRARERLPQLRAANARYDGVFEIPTFEEVLELVAAADAQRAAQARAAGLPPPPRIGIYPETKHPSYFAQLGLHFDDRLLEALRRHGYTQRSDPICIQSFEVGESQGAAQAHRSAAGAAGGTHAGSPSISRWPATSAATSIS